MISIHDILDARILIVDDKAANVLLLEQALSAAGYGRVTSTMDPRAVCELHRKHRYDLILLDLAMPGFDGFQVMEALKEIERDGYLPVLVITAQPDHKLRALKTGARDFVAKPFDLVEVRTRIHNMVEVRLLYRELADHNMRLEQAVRERTAELKDSEARFKRLMELTSDGYWEQDVTGQFTRFAGPAPEMLSIPELQAEIAARRPFLDKVYSLAGSDGIQRKFQVSGEPIFDDSGVYIGYRGIGVDVTARTDDLDTTSRTTARS